MYNCTCVHEHDISHMKPHPSPHRSPSHLTIMALSSMSIALKMSSMRFSQDEQLSAFICAASLVICPYMI